MQFISQIRSIILISSISKTVAYQPRSVSKQSDQKSHY